MRPHNVSHPNVEFTDHRRRRPRRTARSKARGRQLRVAVVRLRRRAHARFHRRQRPRSAVPRRLALPGLCAARVPAGDLPDRRCTSWTTTAPPRRSTARPATRCGSTKVGHARGRLAGDRRQAGPAVRAGAVRPTATSPGNGRFVALSMRTGQVVWSKPDRPRAPSPRRSSSATRSTSATRPATSTR